MVSALARVLDAIACAALGDDGGGKITIGAITLRPHQRDALVRVRVSIEHVGGALLADEPGLGKTFVARALAHEYGGALVVAPAALRAMWRDAAAKARVGISFVSFESLSRADIHADANVRLVIVDEAHHACNPSAARYARLARLTAYRHVLLLSATPVRNRSAELAALLALFIGPRARLMGDVERAQCTVRRHGDAALLPAIDGPHWHRMRTLSRLDSMIAQLPPALPALDGRAATALIAMTLARSWASSLAAFDSALRRRVLRGAALTAILDEGRVPTRDELRAWVLADDSMQLAFPVLVAHQDPDAERFRSVLDAHLAAIRAIRERIQPAIQGDSDARAQLLLDLRAAHPVARIVAFTSYAETAESVYRSLRRYPGVALLTSRGARTAGGARPRGDIISALSASSRRPAHDEISLVITTDLLSEGVNLQGASVVVHLDVPWTPAGLDQRVGRVARMGSPHTRVHVHRIATPASAERLLRLDRRFHRKRLAHIDATSAPDAAEKLRALVRPWQIGTVTAVPKLARAEVRPDVQNPEHPPCLTACVRASRDGLIAVIGSGAEARLLCASFRAGRWNLSDAPYRLIAMAQSILGDAAETTSEFQCGAHGAVRRWLAHRSARGMTGALSAPSRARRMLLAHIDAHSQRAAAHSRAALSHRIEKVRELIDQAISVGAEQTLASLACRTDTRLDALLSACEAQLPAACTQSARANGPWTLRALLLLRVA
ncbi:MAG TPA: helicase-related protein [Gemmatimonadaceae bacterium]|nr:helicase-related protein [Gemmatimonadaceae bacterium]